MSSFSQFMSSGTSLDLEGREQIKTKDLLDIRVTVEDYSLIKGAHGKTAIVVFKEMPNGFYFAGKALTGILSEIETAGKHEDLKKEGMKIILYTSKRRNGEDFAAVKEWE